MAHKPHCTSCIDNEQRPQKLIEVILRNSSCCIHLVTSTSTAEHRMLLGIILAAGNGFTGIRGATSSGTEATYTLTGKLTCDSAVRSCVGLMKFT
jgi:hypothetical protein